MTKQRTPIPEPTKRAVRQRCGFGCVFCGLPLYEYEHMEEWAQVQRHAESEITLLCDRHHKEKTNGLLPIERVREANRDPYNLRTGVSTGYDLHYSGESCDFKVGGCDFMFSQAQRPATAIVFAIGDVPLLAFTFEDGQLLLTIQVFNQAGEPVLWIDRNELKYRTDSWDVSFVGQTLTVRQGSRHILFEVRFAPPNVVEVTRGYLQINGQEILVRPDALYFLNTGGVFQRCGYIFSHAAIMVDRVQGIPSALATGGNANFKERSREETVEGYKKMGIEFDLDDDGKFIFRGAESET
jgi:hypothetical protein